MDRSIEDLIERNTKSCAVLIKENRMGNWIGREYGCPACAYKFPDIGGIGEWYGESETYPFCPECGQRLTYPDKD